MPGSGKSTVGRQLARRLQLPFTDSDHVIEARLGYSIRQYFEQEGEARFRDLEASVIDELTRDPRRGVLSTGGGSVLRPENRRHLHDRSRVIYLKSSPDELFRRLRHDRNRPLLQVDDPLGALARPVCDPRSAVPGDRAFHDRDRPPDRGHAGEHDRDADRAGRFLKPAGLSRSGRQLRSVASHGRLRAGVTHAGQAARTACDAVHVAALPLN